MILVGNGKIEIKSDKQILKEAKQGRILVAENVEVDMETLRRSQREMLAHKRLEAAIDVVDAFIKALYPEDRERLEAYIKGE